MSGAPRFEAYRFGPRVRDLWGLGLGVLLKGEYLVFSLGFRACRPRVGKLLPLSLRVFGVQGKACKQFCYEGFGVQGFRVWSSGKYVCVKPSKLLTAGGFQALKALALKNLIQHSMFDTY